MSFGWVGRVLAWCIILGCVAAISAAVIIPRVAGATPYTVLTGSMRPGLPPGSLVVVRPVDPEDVGVGDVVTIQLRSGEPVFVTHRVVEVQRRLDGQVRFVTQGDDNATPDSEVRRPEQVRGRLWYSVPYLGHVNTWATGQQRQVAVYVVAGGLLVYAGLMFASAAVGRRSRREREEVSV